MCSLLQTASATRLELLDQPIPILSRKVYWTREGSTSKCDDVFDEILLLWSHCIGRSGRHVVGR